MMRTGRECGRAGGVAGRGAQRRLGGAAVPPLHPARRRSLVRRARRRHDPRVRVHPDAPFPGAHRRAARRARPPSTCAASSCPAAAGPTTRAGPPDVSVSVKAYFALKLVGDDAERAAHGARPRGDPRARRDRGDQLLHAHLPRDLRPVGRGTTARRCRPSSSCCPTGSRSPSTRCPPGRARSSCRCRSSGRASPSARAEHAPISELRTGVRSGRGRRRARRARRSGTCFFIGHRLDVLKCIERPSCCRCGSGRSKPREKWIHERLVTSDGLGAIFPPIINTIMAFGASGYASTTRG